jgi:hypothetical protein
LAEEHGHELTSARKAQSMAFSSSFLDRLVKLGPRKQLEKLTKYATKSIHHRPSFCDEGFLAEITLLQKLIGAYQEDCHPFFLQTGDDPKYLCHYNWSQS